MVSGKEAVRKRQGSGKEAVSGGVHAAFLRPAAHARVLLEDDDVARNDGPPVVRSKYSKIVVTLL